jgi:uncharacterized membrane protein
MENARRLSIFAFASLAALSLAWELWLAPLRPGGSMLALKALPLAMALPGIARGRLRTYQWWSMGILAYLCEGVVRATSDGGTSARIALAEILLAALAFASVLAYVRAVRRSGTARASGARG